MALRLDLKGGQCDLFDVDESCSRRVNAEVSPHVNACGLNTPDINLRGLNTPDESARDDGSLRDRSLGNSLKKTSQKNVSATSNVSDFDESGMTDATYKTVIRNRNAIMARALELDDAKNVQEMESVLDQIRERFSRSYGQKILNAYMRRKNFSEAIKRVFKRQLNLKYPARPTNAMRSLDIAVFAERCLALLDAENDTESLIVASLVLLLSFTGKRVSDILNLTIEDLNMLRENGILAPYIRKTGKWSRITLLPDQMRAVDKIVEALEDRVGAGEKLGAHVPPSVRYKKFCDLYGAVLDKPKPRGLGFHALRSGYAAAKFMRGRSEANDASDSAARSENDITRSVSDDLDHSRSSKLTAQYINGGLVANGFSSETFS